MRAFAILMAGTVMTAAVPAWAGEEPLYQPAPAWVAAVPMPDIKSGPPILILDSQERIEQGRLSSYTDQAIRVDNPQMMTALGTLQAGWLPDKGDLIVHRVAILRDGQEINLLDGGARFQVLRREQRLEQRMLDGAYTATMSVPGMRVGDVLRLSYTVTNSDQVLDKEVQTLSPLPAAPFQAKFARVRYSWPQNAGVQWRTTRGAQVREFSPEQGFDAVEVSLPLATSPEMPEDSPLRYRMPAMLQAGTFASWADVSRVMAPHYSTDGKIAAGSPVAAEISKIEQQHSGKLERAVAALRLVQDEIAYLANGLDGGNYMPQAPADTWEYRYGDCKAKTLLLLSMLRAMGIEAEATLVASRSGDGVSDMLPMAAAFDHVIVRAVIDGTEYWLDGTSSGANMAVVYEVPAFHVALPLRAEGSELLPMAQRPQQTFDIASTITFDQRAGLDLQQVFDAEWILSGAMAGQIRGIIGQSPDKEQRDFIVGFASQRLGDALVADYDIRFDAAANTARVKVSGLIGSAWKWERGRGKQGFGLPTSSFSFQSDRSRAAWRDVPVAMPGPYFEQTAQTVLLPDAAAPYRIEGKSAVAETLAGVELARETSLDGTRLTIRDSARWPGGELTAEQARAERARVTRFGSGNLQLTAPVGAPRAFDHAQDKDRRRYAPIEDAYARIIAADPEEMSAYLYRLSFRIDTFDRAGALQDINTVLEHQPSADNYMLRSYVHEDAGKVEEALADAETAWDLAPSVAVASQRAELMRYVGREEEAIALLQEQGGTPEEERDLILKISDFEAQLGRKDEGLLRIDELLLQRPGDPALLNAKCWYQATWNYQPEDLVNICTQAVESADWSPPILDSRGMAYYRLGRYQEALKDLDAALAASPDLTPTLYMRGIVKRAMGDRSGQADIAKALAIMPSLRRFYALYGITPE